MEIRTPRDADEPIGPPVRTTDLARRALHSAALVLGVLAVGMAVLVGTAAAGHQAPAPAPGTVIVQAELLEPSPLPEVAMVNADLPTRARWTAPSGVTRTGLLRAEAGLARGAQIPISVDAAGLVVDARIHIADPQLTGLTAGLSTLLACWTVLALIGAVCRARLEAVDAQQWAAEWARVEPDWSGRAG
ncbi:hypothetical protein [Pseudonocardia sp.]|uniref:Rv1733c family protein n=1 Tax=Pseudonocardia sp. TaxID=60912 RepID=UPI002D85A083|nr:hypothetical protein [Pseudonocardia sp.]